MLMTILLLGFLIGNIFAILKAGSSRGILGPMLLGVVGAFCGLITGNLLFSLPEGNYFATQAIWVSSLLGSFVLLLLSELAKSKR